jgi:hypothetical protein
MIDVALRHLEVTGTHIDHGSRAQEGASARRAPLVPGIRARVRASGDGGGGPRTRRVPDAPGVPDAPDELAAAVREALRRRLASYKIPKRIIPVPTLDDLAP